MKPNEARKLIASKFDAEKVRITKTGFVDVMQGYFYRNGSAESYAARVAAALGLAPEKVEGVDEWAAWPKTSYFVARFALADLPA